ncbi:tetratricopeptide repeat protein, partial [Psychrobacter urativorans]
MKWQIPKQTIIYKTLALAKSLKLPISDTAVNGAYNKLLAAKDNADAQFNLGMMYSNGSGVIEDDNIAVEWLQKAASKGHAIAQFYLAQKYDKGIGVLQDDA